MKKKNKINKLKIINNKVNKIKIKMITITKKNNK